MDCFYSVGAEPDKFYREGTLLPINKTVNNH